MTNMERLCSRLVSYLEEEQIEAVGAAYDYAAQAHEGQRRRSGEPYITHPLAVANILADMHMDHYCLMAAMLHDVIEDTEASKTDLENRFGNTVAELVDGVSKLTNLEARGDTIEERQAENFLKMTLAMSKDIRVILVKLADRLHNMRTLAVLGKEKRRRIARETLDIYAPIAQRLGINDLRIEFEDRGFQVLYPVRAERLAAALKQARGRRKDLVKEIQESIEVRLEKEGFEAKVDGREKHLYGIYRKMKKRNVSFKDIMDVYAFRIIVDSVDQCYRALGIVHNLYKPVIQSFKDYVAIPKANGYQSLHTVLVGMHGVPIEVQIRTQAMDDMANYGIAAHWFYKTKGNNNQVGAISTRASEWVRRLLEMQQQAGNPLEFIEHVKTDLFPDEVYVFTPKGKIIELPMGSTAIDYAYAVHTDIGNSCVGCRINNQPSPLSKKLQSGQMVEILRAQKAQPHPGWLEFVVTAKARSAIRHSLKHQRHEESVSLGRRLLNRTFVELGITLDDIPKARLDKISGDGNHQSFDEVLQQIGLGDRSPFTVAKLLVAEEDAEKLTDQSLPPVLIDAAAEGQVVHYGRCCHPIPGDPIVGHFSTGRGLVVHREVCPNIAEIRHNPELCLAMNWSSHAEGEDFQVELWVDVDMFRGVVAQLAGRIANDNGGIDNISIEERGSAISVIKLMLRVTDRVHLATIMRHIRLEPYVKKIRRGANV